MAAAAPPASRARLQDLVAQLGCTVLLDSMAMSRSAPRQQGRPSSLPASVIVTCEEAILLCLFTRQCAGAVAAMTWE